MSYSEEEELSETELLDREMAEDLENLGDYNYYSYNGDE